jgi:RNA polymerase sigma-70 factor, ECF subfamily
MPATLVKHPDSSDSDLRLAQRVAQGDHGAIEALMRRYNQRLYRVARSILRNEADAEEAVQEAFYLAYRAMGRFRGDAKLSTWLVRIVVNESNRRLRKINRLSTWLEFNSEAQRSDEVAEANMDTFLPNQPEQAAALAQTRQLIESRIDRLPDAFRAVFVLRAVEELSVDETAACLGILPATVRTRYFRARNLLRKLLASEVGADLEGVFSFAGERCDRIVAHVLARLNDGQANESRSVPNLP